MSDSKPKGMKKKTLGSIRARAGMAAKAGKRRPPHIASERDRAGRRQWRAA